MIRAVAYCRYSSDNQREESIDAQLRAIRSYCEKNNYALVDTYIDEAKSATTAKRPSFQKMLSDSSANLFDVVIVHKLDRFSRDRYDSAFCKRKLRENGIKLFSVLENLDDSPESIILESLLEGMAEYYSANLARETMKGMKETAYQCKHNGGTPPLGYDVDSDKHYVINKEEAEAVRIIFDWYAKDRTYSAILEELNRLGYKTKRGGRFGKNSLHDILVNEKYIGTYVFNKSVAKINGKRNNRITKAKDEIIRIENGMPAIIDKKTWEEVQEKMKNNKSNGRKSAKQIYLLSGLIYCGSCDGSMHGITRHCGRNKTAYSSYECTTRKRKGKDVCSMKAIGKNIVENAVIDHLLENVFSISGSQELAEKIYTFSQTQNKGVNTDLANFKKQLSQIDIKINNIVDAIADGMFHPSMKEKMDALEARKEELQIKIAGAEHINNVHSLSKEKIAAYLTKDADIKEKSPEEQKKIIQTYIKRVTIYENKIDIETIVTLNGGGDGNRTRVRKSIPKTFYECSPGFISHPIFLPRAG